MSINITEEGRRTVIAKPQWFPRPDGLERAVVFQPGYKGDRTGNPRTDYGVHGMEIAWYLRGPKGAVQFKIYTDWVPGQPATPSICHLYPMGADVGYHARVPQYEGQENYARDDCEFTGGRCYYDGSGMAADALVKKFIVEGEPVVWAELEDQYERIEDGAS